jgi:hypothetical protein
VNVHARRRGRSLRAPIAIAGAVALIAVTFVAVRALAGGSGDCGGGVKLLVAAAPEIEPAVREAAGRFSATKPKVSGDCVQVQVKAAEPADVANQLAGRAGGTINVAASAAPSPADADVPAVWIPDSTAWITRMQGVNREAFEAQITPVATSPVVFAAPERIATALGGGSVGAPQVAALLAKVAGKELQVAAVDPRRSTAALAGAGLLYDAIVTDPKKLVDVVRAYRSTAVAPDPATLLKATAPQVAPMSEQAVLAYDAISPPGVLTALPLEPAVTLDYPFAVVSGKPRAATEAAELFRTALGADINRDVFTRRGFRGPDGSAAPGFPAGHGATRAQVAVKPLAEPQKIADILGYWNATTAPSRVLTLVDITSSMNRPMVVRSGAVSRLEVLRKTATEGLNLFTDDSELGLWAYAAGLPGGKDYQEVVPVAQLNKGQRARLTTAVSAAKAAPTDVCGLYETVLAAYQSLKDGYKEGRSNTVVVFTDGANSKPGMSLETLKLELERATDPTRPVRVVLLGVGPDANKQELDAIAAATGGRAFVVQDPDQIGNIFLQALIRSG